jgi:hypothetical protein
MAIVNQFLQIVHHTAAAIPTFNERLGPGADKSNGATRNFVRFVNRIVAKCWPDQVQINKPARHALPP